MLKKIALVLNLLFFANSASAEIHDSFELKIPDTSSPIIYGSIDTSYNYLSRRNHFINGGYNRMNDLQLNGLALQQLNITFANLPKSGLGELLNVVAGQDANNLAPKGINPNMLNIQNVGVTIPEAFIQYQTALTNIQIGELLSLAGFEQIDYPSNTNFSRSILNGFAQSGSHIGFRLIRTITEKVTTSVGVNNGWNTIRLPGQQNNLEAAIIYTPFSAVSFTLDGSMGPAYLTDNALSGPRGRRYLLDFFATWQVTPKFDLAINGDYGAQSKAALPNAQIGRAIWQGIAGYVNYRWQDQWLASLRGEIFDDSDGYRSHVRQNWRELTLSLAYLPIKHLQIRAETRYDFSNVNAYVNKNNARTGNHIWACSMDMLYAF